MNLSEAIRSLDPKNDEHWTENGLPQLAVLKELTGKHVSRKEATDAEPLVTRGRLLGGENTTIRPPEADISQNPEVEVGKKSEEDEAPVESEPEKVDVEALDEEIAEYSKAIHDLDEEINALQRVRVDLVAKRDACITKKDDAQRVNPNAALQHYFATRAKVREELLTRRPGEPSDLDRRLMTRARNPRPITPR